LVEVVVESTKGEALAVVVQLAFEVIMEVNPVDRVAVTAITVPPLKLEGMVLLHKDFQEVLWAELAALRFQLAEVVVQAALVLRAIVVGKVKAALL
jgi:hypothetical protein